MGKRPTTMREKERFDVLPPFNNKEALTVVQVEEGKLGVVDADTLGVWIEHDLKYTFIPNWRKLPRVHLRPPPSQYGSIKSQWIGGVSRTFRRVGCLRAKASCKDPVTLFATNLPEEDTARKALEAYKDIVTVGDCETDTVYGYVSEVIVHSPSEVDFVSARIARGGGKVFFEDNTNNSNQAIAIERLDRISSKVCNFDSCDDRKEAEEFGLGRGSENWIFSQWLPTSWKKPPITWDYMVENVSEVDDVSDLPFPLRQHVAKARYAACKDKSSNEAKSLLSHISARDGTPKKRKVSAGLSRAQSIQLMDAFYSLCVERVDDPLQVHATSLVMFHYMLRQGYTARWLGKYQQEARFIGNGMDIRKFRRLTQYDPHRLPASVLNKMMQRSGVVKGKGGKGSRSKYVDKSERYVPKQRVSRDARKKQRDKMVIKEGGPE